MIKNKSVYSRYPLFLKMHMSLATMESSVEGPQKARTWSRLECACQQPADRVPVWNDVKGGRRTIPGSSDLHAHVSRPRHIHTTINKTIYFKKPPCLTFPVTSSSIRHRCESIRQDLMVVMAVVTVIAEATSFRSHQLESCGQESCVSGPDVSPVRRTDNHSNGSAQPPPHFPGAPRVSLVPWKPNVLK